MDLVLVRHAQPAWAAPDGRSSNDPGLSELGREQARRLGVWLARPEARPADEIVVSRYRRSIETAAALEAALGLTATVEPWLAEIGSPAQWDGAIEADVVRELAAMKQRTRSEWWDGAPGGETFRDFHKRVTEGLDQFLRRYGVREHPEDPVHLWDIPAEGPRLILVAHAGTNSVIISHLLGIEPQPWEWERFACDHASVSVLRSRSLAGGAIWSLDYFSDVAHLPAASVTA